MRCVSLETIEISSGYADFAALVWRDRRSTALPQARPANIRKRAALPPSDAATFLRFLCQSQSLLCGLNTNAPTPLVNVEAETGLAIRAWAKALGPKLRRATTATRHDLRMDSLIVVYFS